eukprot:gene13611-65891_t
MGILDYLEPGGADVETTLYFLRPPTTTTVSHQPLPAQQGHTEDDGGQRRDSKHVIETLELTSCRSGCIAARSGQARACVGMARLREVNGKLIRSLDEVLEL